LSSLFFVSFKFFTDFIAQIDFSIIKSLDNSLKQTTHQDLRARWVKQSSILKQNEIKAILKIIESKENSIRHQMNEEIDILDKLASDSDLCFDQIILKIDFIFQFF
jgi:predicted component of type VI protein secretion system